MTHVPNAGTSKPGAVNLPITRTYPVDAWFRLYTVTLDDNGNPVRDDDGNVVKNYLDFTDYTGTAQVRAETDSALLLDTVVSFEVPPFAAEGEVLGWVHVFADADETEDLVVVVAKWDLRLVDPDGVPRRWLKGSAPIEDPVTEEEGS